MKRLVLLSFFTFTIVFNYSNADESKSVIILNFSDFGPPSMSNKTLGQEWWQWNACGGPNPNQKFDVKVVVYRNISLQEVKEMYPVIKEKKQDYRYLEYNTAIQYFNEQIEELQGWNKKAYDALIASMISDLQQTKGKIEEALN